MNEVRYSHLLPLHLVPLFIVILLFFGLSAFRLTSFLTLLFASFSQILLPPRHSFVVSHSRFYLIPGDYCANQGTGGNAACKPSRYCPTPRESILCPSGHYCPPSTSEPHPCDEEGSEMAYYCPEGMTHYSPLAYLSVLDGYYILI